MLTVEELLLPIKTEMNEFELRFRQNMRSKVPLLDKITHYIIRRKGKQMRPMFVFLTTKMLGEMNDKAYDAASLIELLHTATLVHDDVVDDANERRGFFSINALWKNKVAVLVGDYMLSKVLLLSIEKNNVRLLEVVARAVREMSEGELLQIEKARRLDITEDVYFDVIRQKTASLISTCCEAGAISADREDMAEKMRRFGEYVGLAFQLKDDIFDYGTPGKIGKPTGLDIRERKLTLPMIYTLHNAPKAVKSELINIIKNHNEEKRFVSRAIELVTTHGGLEYAHNKMMEMKGLALNELTDIPDSVAKRTIIGLVEYTTLREK
jgi:octaprenyl-diphosphate synthase